MKPQRCVVVIVTVLTLLCGVTASARRAAGAADAPKTQPAGEPAAVATAAQALQRKIPEVKFDNVGISDVFDFLRDVSGVNIAADWKRLEAAGVARDKPVNDHAENLEVADLLTRVINKAADPKHPVKWANAGGIVLVSTPDAIEAYEAAGKALAPDGLDEPSRKLLDLRVHELDFDGTALGDAFNFIGDVSGARIEVDWKALRAAGVDQNAKVTLRLRDATVGQVTRLMLLSVTDKTPLRLSVKAGQARVTADAVKK
jgi:hypothetical protein